ncbi:eucine-rich repeat receptor-like protein kinase [Platanthera zijinensis]|uniref:Eucine-rich repeat receptor-like protein kinase n=1 Tax=Platanthera zijinensis TaxID=2320716 RepID=A0AAP0FXY3_9ASPA
MTMASAIISLLLLIYVSPSSPAPTPLLNDQVLGLILFKAGIHDSGGGALRSWSPDDTSPCSWSHVTCINSTSVSSLSLSSLSLSSSSFPRGLQLLPSLTFLSLSFNNFSGSLPSPFPSLPLLSYLSLSSNSLSGSIPDILPCFSLRFLSLSSNLLSGPIPPSLTRCSLLLHLNLSSNRLTGDFSSILSFLPLLRVLDLSFNSLSGPLPASLASLHRLKILNLSGNQLSGRLPLSLAGLSHILSLDLSRNQFFGAFPQWLPFLTALLHLDFSGNRLDGDIPDNLSALRDLSFMDLSFNSLSGNIPTSFANCSNLAELRLAGNWLTGSIPPAIFDMGLRVLDLAGNKLNGSMPSASPKLAGVLQWLDLAGNRLVGEILPHTALFTNLQYLNLSWNQLHSNLPPVIGQFKNLSVLDLRSSGVYGQFPGDICNSGSITVLQLDGNSLSGPIPDEIQNCSNLHLLSLSHNNLKGTIPAAMAELKKLEILKLEFNSLSGKIPPQLGSLTNLVALNISNNLLVGRLPAAGVFPSLDQSALAGNMGLCSPLVAEPCIMDDIPKPLVLDPDTINQGNQNRAGNNRDRLTPSTGAGSQSRHRRLLSLSAIIAIAAALFILFGILVITLLNVCSRRRLENALESFRSTTSRSTTAGKIVTFGPKLPDVCVITSNAFLSKTMEIGRGAFGIVYRTAEPAVIRKLLPNSALQNHDDFDREVRALANARHPNLLTIKGYYFTSQVQLLITDFAEGGSLYSRLHGSGFVPLSWPQRFNIALGAARGLAHLHRGLRPQLIHCNVKSSNVLLDAEGEAKVADFGLTRLLRPQANRPAAARGASVGYAAPELAYGSLRGSEKCDVYGFGVLLLEIVTGRKGAEVVEDEMVMLVDEVRAAIERGEAAEWVDAKMCGLAEEAVPVLKLGLVCASQIPSSRPSMTEVVQILEVIKAPVVDRMAAFS